MHAAAVGRPVSMQPSPRGTGLTGQGNCQPGYPLRPSEGTINNSLSSNPSEGHSGQPARTDYSPDTTTKDLTSYQQPSFLAFKAGDVPTTVGQMKPNIQNTQSSSPLVGTASGAPQNVIKKEDQPTIDGKLVIGSAEIDDHEYLAYATPLSEMTNKTENLMKNTKPEAPPCDCFGNENGPDTGPYYTHLGVADSIKSLREIFEKRCGVTGNALRIEKAKYCNREGKTSLGCPIAKYIIRRKNFYEKYLVICKDRVGHKCKYKWIVVSIVAWEGVQGSLANSTYDNLSVILGQHGKAFQRQCETNSKKTCACQGVDDKFGGASFTFGCSWSMYFDGCKYGKAGNKEGIRKFKLNKDAPSDKEHDIENNVHSLTKVITPLFSRLAPDAFENMTAFDKVAPSCRIGHELEGRPFSGVTAVCDFCAHSHRDVNNMNAGCTLVLTLTKPENRGIYQNNPDDEQLHVLPHYMIDDTDEFGSTLGQAHKIKCGELEVLTKFDRTLIKRSTPKKGAKRGHPTGARKRFLDSYLKASKNCNDITSAVNIALDDQPRPPKRSRKSSIVMPPQQQQPQMVFHHQPQQHIVHQQVPTHMVVQQHQAYMGPLSPPNEQEDLNMMLQEHFQSKPSPHWYPNAYSGGPDTTIPPQVATIPQVDGGEEYYPGHQQPFQPGPQFPNHVTYSMYHHFQPNFQNLMPPPPPPQYQPLTPSSVDASPVTSPVKQEPDDELTVEASTCSENFGERNIDVGGLAIALPHGSVLIECAKHELHATTALKQPNRHHPTRIGLVFYQHKNLIYPQHGYQRVQEKTYEKNARDYEAWKVGKFTPTPRKLQLMKDDGFVFPDNVKTVPPGSDMNVSHDDLEVKQEGKPFLPGDIKTLPSWVTIPTAYHQQQP